jgi:enoyl-CoA hydratase/carnithine racemase
MTSSQFQHLLYEVQGGVAEIVLNRPDKLNALGIGPGSNREEIIAALRQADADDAVGCILVRANGKAFCAGGDLSGGGAGTPLDEHLFGASIVAFYAAIRAIHKPIVVAIHGLCLGAGMGFVAQCDLLVASSDARFGLIEGRIGHPGATELVPVIGAAWAKFLILTGELIDAERARSIGLLLCVEPPDQLLARTRELARRIASLPREGVLLNKACIADMSDAMGRAAARLVGRAHDSVTKSMAASAKAPDGRRFADILREGGVDALKRARDQQYQGNWLAPSARKIDGA